MAKDVIIACDFETKEETIKFLNRFKDKKPYVKIGMELYYSEGNSIVKELKERGHKIFLDLKLCDIPNTVKGAVKVLSKLEVDMINLHTFGGSVMMKEAVSELNRIGTNRPLLIGVTLLTSTSSEILKNEMLIDKKTEEVVISYAKNAKLSGLDGVVCSPLEASRVHEVCSENFITVTPGIRFSTDASDDQVRITTPKEARKMSSDYIVVGRPITRSTSPVEAYERCLKEFLG